MAIDEETTICPPEHSHWIHNENQKEYKILGPQLIKFNSDWHEGVAYESTETGKRYWRKYKEFYQSFKEKSDQLV